MKLDSIHNRTKKLTNVAIDVEVLSCVAEIGLCKRQKVLKIWNQCRIGVWIFEAEFSLSLQFSQSTVFGLFWINDTIPCKPFAIDPKCVVRA